MRTEGDEVFKAGHTLRGLFLSAVIVLVICLMFVPPHKKLSLFSVED